MSVMIAIDFFPDKIVFLIRSKSYLLFKHSQKDIVNLSMIVTKQAAQSLHLSTLLRICSEKIFHGTKLTP